MATWFQLTLLAALIAASGCNATGMSGSVGPTAGSGKSQDKKKSEASELGAEAPDTEDNEEDAADQPVPVSGSFLTCAEVGVPGGDDGTDYFGCVIERQNGKVPNDQFSATYALSALPDKSPLLEAKFEAADDLSLWHVFISVPSGTSESYEVTAAVRWATAAGEKPEILQAVLKKNGDLKAIRFGVAREFHIGNNEYHGGSCQQRINTTPLYGTTLALRIALKEGNARAAFHIKGICGVDYNNAAFVRVRDADGKILTTVEIRRGVSELQFALTGLAAGTYSLELISILLRHNDHDDFVIGDVTVVSDKPIGGELPQL